MGVGVLPPEDGHALVVLTNFGLLLPRTLGEPGHDATVNRARYDFACEETFGGLMPPRIARAAEGPLVLIGHARVYVGLANGCGFAASRGAINAGFVGDVAIDPTDPNRVFAFTRLPDALHVSFDGGATFDKDTKLPADVFFERVFANKPNATASGLAPIVRLAGYNRDEPLVLLRSDDDGATFTSQRFSATTFTSAAGKVRAATLLAVSPIDSDTLFLAVGLDAGADEIWRSRDSGRSWQKVLTLVGTEAQVGLVISDDGRKVYVAGREPFPLPAGELAHLYRSNDGGDTFDPPIPSAPGRPIHGCLVIDQGGTLYGCGDVFMDPFLIARSNDGGDTWTPVVTVADINGPLACASEMCAATTAWLCNVYGACASGSSDASAVAPDALDGASSGDTGTSGPAIDAVSLPTTNEPGGCGCRVGHGFVKDSSFLAPIGFAICIWIVLLARTRRPPRPRSCRADLLPVARPQNPQ
jgi:hypothetical protein